MSEEKLGQHEQAIRTLSEAESVIPTELRTLGTNNHKAFGSVGFRWFCFSDDGNEFWCKKLQRSASGRPTPTNCDNFTLVWNGVNPIL